MSDETIREKMNANDLLRKKFEVNGTTLLTVLDYLRLQLRTKPTTMIGSK